MPRKNPTRTYRVEILENRRVLAVNAFADVLQFGDSGWYLNNTHYTNLDMATNFEPIASGDFTRDGTVDVLGQANGQWWLQVNDGGQLFGVPWGDLPTAENQFLDTGDFNHDGWLDVLSRDPQTGDFLLDAGSQDGFQTQLWGNWTTNVEWDNFQVGDFDADGLLDVLATESSGNWWLAKNYSNRFLNHHWGRFQDFNWKTIVTGHFNGDSFLDAAALGQDNTWWLWDNVAGSTGFLVPRYFGHWKMADDWSDVSVADLNNDRRDDLIGRDQDGSLWVGSSMGDRFQTWSWGTGWIASAEWTNVEHFDVDRDGLVDQVGQAKDGTLWIAQNHNGKFQNHYWTAVTGSPGFVDYVSDFQQDDRVSLARLFPGATEVFQPREDTVQKETGVRNMDDRVQISVNEDGFFVVEGNGAAVAGLDFNSASGSLRPAIAGKSLSTFLDQGVTSSAIEGFSQAGAEPFQFFLANTSTQITIANLGWNVTVTDPIVLNFGYESTGARDLLVSFGDGPTAVPAFVDEELFDPETEITTFKALSVSPIEIAEDNVTAYNLVAPNWESGAFLNRNSSPAPILAASSPSPVRPLASVPLTGELRDGKIVLISTEPVRAAGLDFQSVLGLLEPISDPPGPVPFTLLLSNTRNQITWGNLGSTVTIDGELVTAAGYTGDPTSGDLRLFVGIHTESIEIPLS